MTTMLVQKKDPIRTQKYIGFKSCKNNCNAAKLVLVDKINLEQ